MHFSLDGSRKSDSWWPRVLMRYNDNPLGDCIYLDSSVLIISEEVVGKLLEIFGEVEILPIFCNFGEYKAINVLDVLDCVDYCRSRYKRFPKKNEEDLPRIMMFESFSFKSEKIKGHHIFKILDLPKSAIFVDDFFVSEVQRHNITGLKFSAVWNSDSE